MKIAIVGCGNMARAIFGPSEVKNSSYEFLTYTPSKTKAVQLARHLDGRSVDVINEMKGADLLFLGFKPQNLSQVSLQLKEITNSKTLIISVLAGSSIETIAEQLEVESHQVVRVMPNTPSAIGQGLHAIYGESRDNTSMTEELFSHSGEVITLTSEDQIDLITPFSGSGPAYVFEILSHYCDGLIERGFSKEQAKLIMGQTFRGSAQYFLDSSLTGIELRDQVTSKKGVTFEALKVLQNGGLEGLISDSLKAADKRTKELKELK